MEGNTEESHATEKILTGRFDIVKFALEYALPFLKIFPSKARRDLENAERILFGLINRVCTEYEIVNARSVHQKN